MAAGDGAIPGNRCANPGVKQLEPSLAPWEMGRAGGEREVNRSYMWLADCYERGLLAGDDGDYGVEGEEDGEEGEDRVGDYG